MSLNRGYECLIEKNRQVNVCRINEDDYICQVKKLLRIGPLWSIIRDTESNLCKLIECIASAFYNVHEHICSLAREANPCTSTCDQTLQDWAKIYNIYECTDVGGGTIPLTRELICTFAEQKSSLNCAWISQLAKHEGYDVINCETSCQLGPIKEISCRAGIGMFAYVPGKIIDQINTECERKYAEFPCSNCCPSDEIETERFTQDCNLDRNPGGCAICNNNCQNTFRFASNVNLSEVQELCNPSTITITLAGPPPCVTPFSPGKGFGRPFSSNNTEFKLCLLETQIPAHMCVIYKFEEEC